MSDKPADFHKIFAVLHRALIAAENNEAQLRFGEDLNGRECVLANAILQQVSDMLMGRWEAEGKPDPDTVLKENVGELLGGLSRRARRPGGHP